MSTTNDKPVNQAVHAWIERRRWPWWLKAAAHGLTDWKVRFSGGHGAPASSSELEQPHRIEGPRR